MMAYIKKLFLKLFPNYLLAGRFFPTHYVNRTWSDAQPTRNFMAILATIAGFTALTLGIFGQGETLDRHHPLKVIQAVMLVIWIVAPPVWFWYEYFYLFKRTSNTNPDFDGYKYGQDQSAKIWLALVTVLFGLYFGKDLWHVEGKSTDKPAPCVTQSNP